MRTKAESFFYLAELLLAALVIYFVVQVSRLRMAKRNNQRAVIEAVSNPTGSVARLEKAKRIDGHNPVYPFNLGLLRAEQVKLSVDDLLSGEIITLSDSTLAMLGESVSLSLGEPVFMLNLALSYCLKGDRDSALSLLTPVVAQEYCWSPLRIFYGMLQEKDGKREIAAAAYVRAVMQSPIVLESQFYRDLVIRDEDLARKVREIALRKTKDALERSPSPLLEASLGEQMYLSGLEDAASWLKTALSKQPSLNRPWLFLGRHYDKEGRTSDALACYEKSVLLDKNDALAHFFLAIHKDTNLSQAERYRDMLSYELRDDLSYRWRATIMSPFLIIPGLEEYCTFDFVSQIKSIQKEANMSVLKEVLHGLEGQADAPLGNLSVEIASRLVGTKCEAGLLDVYPEQLRVMLDRTDNLHFIEMCIALAKTYKEYPDAPLDFFYESFCNLVQQLRYRNGTSSKFADRIFYFSEWARQAGQLGILEEYTQRFGRVYSQTFSYLSDHLSFLPQIGREPTAREDVLTAEKTLNDSGPFYLILPETISSGLFEDICHGDILAIVSDRKGEDVSNAGFIYKKDGEVKIIYASMKDKKVVMSDFPSREDMQKGIRLFKIH